MSALGMEKGRKSTLFLVVLSIASSFLILSQTVPVYAIGPFQQAVGTTVTYTDLIRGAFSCDSVSTLAGGKAIFAPDNPGVPYPIPGVVIVGGIKCTVTCDVAGTGAIRVKDVNGAIIDSFTITCLPACAPGGAQSAISSDEVCIPVPEFNIPFAVIMSTAIVLFFAIRFRTNPVQRKGT